MSCAKGEVCPFSAIQPNGTSKQAYHASTCIVETRCRRDQPAAFLCKKLLDEPTNHLDVDAMEWLERYLREYQGTVLVISHDRFFLDAIATTIYHVDGGEVEKYDGNYSRFAKEREERLLRQFAEYEEHQKKIKKMQEAIKRLKEWGHRSNPPNEAFHRRAKSMEKALARIERVERPKLEADRMGLVFQQTERSGQEVLVAEAIAKSYGNKVLFRDASLLLRYGERKALLGPNGCGKSTLIKILLVEIEPDGGQVKMGSRVKIGYLSQTALEGDPHRRVIDVFRETVWVPEGEARQLLARFLFYGEQVFKRVGQLSGGERMRLRLAQLMHQEVNLLVLDEPTNHLDIEAREALEEALADFRGSLLMVSHDRYFLQKMADGVYWVEEGRLVHDHGRYAEAREKQRSRQAKGPREERVAAAPLQGGTSPARKDKPANKANLYKLAEAGRLIAEREARLKELQALLSGSETDYAVLIVWQQELEQGQQELELLYKRWVDMQDC